jgi:GNAT superfamily N-acetyltransferase
MSDRETVTFQELTPQHFEKARSLFDGFDYSLSIRAMLEGNSPGRIFVDNVERPCTAFALTVEGYLLTGDHTDPAVLEGLRRLLAEQIFTGQVYVNGDESMSLAVHPPTWETQLPSLIPTHDAEKLARYHYLCRAVHYDWRQHLPEGYSVQRVDRSVLSDPQIFFPEALRDWFNIEEMWGSLDNFFNRGVSFCALHENQVVAWCTPDCVADDRIDVGIFTDPEHRRRGLASIAVAATVEHCLSSGFSAVGWHCNAENVASWKTAEKVGFVRNREYAYFYYMYDPIDHLAELGWYHYRQRDYRKTVQYYEQVFAQRENNPDYYYHLTASAWALLGQREQALEYLSAAVDHGWADAEFTGQQEEFEMLHNAPEWSEILARMQVA